MMYIFFFGLSGTKLKDHKSTEILKLIDFKHHLEKIMTLILVYSMSKMVLTPGVG